jgi:hypothetical protein
MYFLKEIKIFNYCIILNKYKLEMSISINSVYKFIEKKFLKGFFDNLIKSSKKENILNKKKTN